MDVSKNKGKPPKWMVYFMENPIKMDDLFFFSHYFWVDTHIFHHLGKQLKSGDFSHMAQDHQFTRRCGINMNVGITISTCKVDTHLINVYLHTEK